MPECGECLRYSCPEGGFDLYLSRDIQSLPEHDENIYKLSISSSLPFATIKGTVYLRFRRAGDTLRFGGMTRSVKTLLNGAKIPPQERGRLPVLCDEAGILWIPGFPVRDADAAAADGGCNGYLSITYFLL
jgi:tRNA(Ile)-lysidine synthase